MAPTLTFTLYRDQAAANPAYLPGFAAALSNLGRYQQDAGSSWDADTAWSAALDAMPTSDLQGGLLVERPGAQARDHVGILARPGTRTALDELALAGIDPGLIGQ